MSPRVVPLRSTKRRESTERHTSSLLKRDRERYRRDSLCGIDIWAIGVAAYYMLNWNPPFAANSKLAKTQAVLMAELTFTPRRLGGKYLLRHGILFVIVWRWIQDVVWPLEKLYATRGWPNTLVYRGWSAPWLLTQSYEEINEVLGVGRVMWTTKASAISDKKQHCPWTLRDSISFKWS